MQAKNKEFTIKANNYFLHSKYNPSEEAKKFADAHYKKGHLQILFGYGNGYIKKALENSITNNDKVIVVDPIIELKKENSEQNVLFYNNIEELKLFLKRNIQITDGINIIVSLNYDNLVTIEYRDFLKVLNDIVHDNVVNENTMANFKDIWYKNYLKNIPNLLTDRSFENLERYDVPVLIASGGPSLTKQIPLLKEYRGKFILICAGSTINTLLIHGIQPDIVVSIDGSERNLNHFKDIENLNSIFIYDMYNHPGIRKKFKDSYYFINQGEEDLRNHLKKFTDDDIYSLPGNGSVATFSLALGLFLTSGPVALIGQDLAYTNGVSHAEGNKYIKKINLGNETNTFTAKGYYGDEVITTYPFLSMKDTFEKIAKANNSRSIYNCTEGGIYIDGYINKPFEEFCKTNTSDSIDLSLLRTQTQTQANKTLKQNKILIEFKKEIEVCKELIATYENSLSLLKKNSSQVIFDEKVIKKMSKNDKKIMKGIKNTALFIAFNYVNLYVLKYFPEKDNESEKERYQRVYRQNETMYSMMLEKVIDYKKIIEEIVQSGGEI